MSTPTAALTAETIALLLALATRVETKRPRAEMTEDIRLASALTVAHDEGGAYRDLLAAAPPVRHQTRAEYATLLRLIAQGVVGR
jgi:hypothetical protein